MISERSLVSCLGKFSVKANLFFCPAAISLLERGLKLKKYSINNMCFLIYRTFTFRKFSFLIFIRHYLPWIITTRDIFLRDLSVPISFLNITHSFTPSLLGTEQRLFRQNTPNADIIMGSRTNTIR